MTQLELAPQKRECGTCPNLHGLPLYDDASGVSCLSCYRAAHPDEVTTHCKCGENRPPVFNYTNHETGETAKFCYHCDPHETPEERAMMYEVDGQHKPAYNPNANL